MRQPSTSTPAPRIISATFLGLSPLAGAALCPPWVPLPSEFFLCDLFFKKSWYYFFITAVGAAAGGLGGLFCFLFCFV